MVVKEAFLVLEVVGRNKGLNINQSKTNYMAAGKSCKKCMASKITKGKNMCPS